MRYLCTQKDHGYRDSTNPLRGLNMSRLVGLQESGERGDYADLQWFYYYMERSDAMIHSVIQRRRAALLSLDWDIRIVSQSKDDPLAQEQADFLRMVYDNIGNFREAVSFLFTGFFRGFAHLEKHWTPGGLIERLEPVEQWFWIRDGLFGDWEYNAGAVSGCRRGTVTDPENFVILETTALDRILSVLYLRKNLSQSDWDSYIAVYGIPSIFLVGPPNASEEKVALPGCDSISKVLFQNQFEKLMLHFGILAQDAATITLYAVAGERRYRHVLNALEADLTFLRGKGCGDAYMAGIYRKSGGPEYADIHDIPEDKLALVVQIADSFVRSLRQKSGLRIRDLPSAHPPWEIRGSNPR